MLKLGNESNFCFNMKWKQFGNFFGKKIRKDTKIIFHLQKRQKNGIDQFKNILTHTHTRKPVW
jgi:hypothetical protein